MAVETEHVGEEIISDLSTQRETLERSRGRLQETSEELSQSRRVVRRLYFGVIQNKVILSLVIVIEVVLLIFLIYWKLIRKIK